MNFINKFAELLKANIELADLKNALTVTWQGMAAIFIVMALISVIVFVFAKLSGIKKKH